MKRATIFATGYGGVDTISIHALVKRATKTRAKKEPPVDISIHALVKRATNA